ncbi:hypothetical protein KI387_011352, partial [Taxus chinensis]
VFLVLAVKSVRGDVDIGSVETAHSVQNLDGICALFVSPKGYDCQEFMVPTEDGFLLSVQRVSSATVVKNEKEPVFLYHGIMQGGEGWVLNEPYESLSFMLADSGYDVWIGNGRATTFTYGHKIYNRSSQEFWNWKFDDLVAYDLPSMLYFVNSTTAKSILYVGYSQGTMTGFAGFTNNKIASLVKKVAMLAPIAYLNYVSAPLSRVSAALYVDQLDTVLGIYEFNVSVARNSHILDRACRQANLDIGTCYDGMISLFSGPDCCTNKSKLVYYTKYESQSTSAMNMAQLAQLIRSGRFCKYDYGLYGNMENYGTIIPPSYDLSMIPSSLPFLLVRGGNDTLADELDVKHVASELPGKVELLFIPNYSHFDMLFATTAHVDVYPHVLKFFQEV